MKKLVLALSLGALATPALAEFPVGKLGVNFAPKADLSIDGLPDGDGTGLGFYGELGSTMFFGYVDHQMSDVDIQAADLDITETRIGLGARGGNERGAIELRVEKYDVELEGPGGSVDDDGTGMHLTGELNLTPEAAVFARYGVFSLDETDGPEMRLGVKFRPSDTAELFATYRQTTLEDDFNDEIELSDFRIGGNLLF